ncbi:MAG TPA: M23 family metallopeptidase [Kribbella sp.]|nr:M23 family metallopeptidase [Kribbella sp.]
MRSTWVISLVAAAAVAGAGVFGLTSAGVFGRDQPAEVSGPPGGVSGSPGGVSGSPGGVSGSPAPTRVVTTPRPTRTPTPTQRTSVPVRPSLARYVFPIAGCRGDASQSHHDYPASDIFAKVGCRFVSPVDGRVDEVTRVDTWNPKTNVGADRGGLSVSVVGVDGVRYYGSHLSAIDAGIRPGVAVRAGQVLARTGKTGSARFTPPHLHFAISWPTAAGRWWIRRGVVPPQAFLNSWHDGGRLSPVSLVAKTRRAYGVDRGCRSYC